MENHIRRSVNTLARSVGKPRRGALPPASEAEKEYDGRGRREGRRFENRNEGQGMCFIYSSVPLQCFISKVDGELTVSLKCFSSN